MRISIFFCYLINSYLFVGIPGGIIGGIIPGGGGIIPGGIIPGGIIGGPPIPLTCPVKPLDPVGAIGNPLPTALAVPGPPGVIPKPSSGGGGPSTVMDTTASPRNIINPKALFSSLSSEMPVPFLFFIRLYN